MKNIAAAMLFSSVAMAASPAGAAFIVTYEAPGVLNSTARFAYSGVETFGSVVLENATGPTNFGTGGTISGTYTGVNLRAADQYGGAGGTGSYAQIGDGGRYTVDLRTTDARGINYFGYWLSALDAGNNVTFFKNNAQVFSFSAADVLALIGNNTAYRSNPSGTYRGQNTGESYVFLNFFSDSTFDRVAFSENRAGAGYESDNHTVGFFTQSSGTPVSPVPEPATWAMLIGGFGLVGAAMRRRRRSVRFA